MIVKRFQVKREHLQLEEKLGEGAFGKVFKGLLLTKPNYNSATTVAVKELSGTATKINELPRTLDS